MRTTICQSFSVTRGLFVFIQKRIQAIRKLEQCLMTAVRMGNPNVIQVKVWVLALVGIFNTLKIWMTVHASGAKCYEDVSNHGNHPSILRCFFLLNLNVRYGEESREA